MADNQSKRPLEQLLEKSFELNRQYLNQSAKLFRDLSKRSSSGSNPLIFQPDLYRKAVSAFAKANLEYYNQLLETGLSLTEELVSGAPQAEEEHPRPAFVLEAEARAGEQAQLQFVLENTKAEAAICELVHSPFKAVDDATEVNSFKTTFTPQQFEQEAGASNTVDIAVQIPKNTPPKTFYSDVTVLGFEPSFFRMLITVLSPTKTSKNAKTKRRSAKKE
ncbi:hypothetical protein [Croceiramulus getboli]|nr:hypothetical protein P8624_10695 [Flavobacteriaceae bacterium YJPT1-3]